MARASHSQILRNQGGQVERLLGEQGGFKLKEEEDGPGVSSLVVLGTAIHTFWWCSWMHADWVGSPYSPNNSPPLSCSHQVHQDDGYLAISRSLDKPYYGAPFQLSSVLREGLAAGTCSLPFSGQLSSLVAVVPQRADRQCISANVPLSCWLQPGPRERGQVLALCSASHDHSVQAQLCDVLSLLHKHPSAPVCLSSNLATVIS